MALGTLDRSAPSSFRQGPSALSKLVVFSTLALFLMVADNRFGFIQPLRSVVATVLYPAQWLALQPVQLVGQITTYTSGLSQAQSDSEETARRLALQSIRAGQVEQLIQENARLRKLLALREQVASSVMAAEVLYDAADPYTRKVVIDKGLLQGIAQGSPVLDEAGILGQITRVYPLLSEVTLLTDRDLAVPVLNVRTGVRSVVFGDPTPGGTGLELRFMGSNSDVLPGDLLTTSGVDGVYPAGLRVARISRIERRADSAFAKIYCTPEALVASAHHVMVVQPTTGLVPPRPPAAAVDAAPTNRKKAPPAK